MSGLARKRIVIRIFREPIIKGEDSWIEPGWDGGFLRLLTYAYSNTISVSCRLLQLIQKHAIRFIDPHHIRTFLTGGGFFYSDNLSFQSKHHVREVSCARCDNVKCFLHYTSSVVTSMPAKNAPRLWILTFLKPKTNFPNLILLELVPYLVY